jgi:hypothetical protein
MDPTTSTALPWKVFEDEDDADTIEVVRCLRALNDRAAVAAFLRIAERYVDEDSAAMCHALHVAFVNIIITLLSLHQVHMRRTGAGPNINIIGIFSTEEAAVMPTVETMLRHGLAGDIDQLNHTIASFFYECHDNDDPSPITNLAIAFCRALSPVFSGYSDADYIEALFGDRGPGEYASFFEPITDMPGGHRG